MSGRLTAKISFEQKNECMQKSFGLYSADLVLRTLPINSRASLFSSDAQPIRHFPVKVNQISMMNLYWFFNTPFSEISIMLRLCKARSRPDTDLTDSFLDLRRWWGLIPASWTNARIPQMPDTHGQRSRHRLDERIRENVSKPQGWPSQGNASCFHISLGKE